MTIDWWTLGLQTVNVLVLVWILARFLFRPVAKIISERQVAAHAALDDAEAARDEAREAMDEAKAQAAELVKTRAAKITEAQEEASHEKSRLLDEARAAADKLRDKTRDELAQMRVDAKQDLADEAGVLAADIAARLIARLPDEVRIDGFIEGLAQAVADLPEATRAGIGLDGPVRLRAARALTEDEKAHLTARLFEVLGRSPTVEVDEDPTLIAGLELDAPHAIVRNHFRADLDRIKMELAGHD